jgi:hypothetical protein
MYNSEKYWDIYRPNIKAKSSDSVKKNDIKDIGETTSNNSEFYFLSQPIANVFQILNNEPKVIMRVFYTSD